MVSNKAGARKCLTQLVGSSTPQKIPGPNKKIVTWVLSSIKRENWPCGPLPYKKELRSPIRNLLVEPPKKGGTGPNLKIVCKTVYSTKKGSVGPSWKIVSGTVYPTKKEVWGSFRKLLVGPSIQQNQFKFNEFYIIFYR